MKKAEVKIGGKYYANVSGNRVEIQIDSEKVSGGWNATNLATGKKIQIKSAQRLLGVVAERKGRTKAAKKVEEAAAVESQPAEVAGEDKAVVATATETKSTSKAKRQSKPTVEVAAKKISCIDAAFQILTDTKAPLNTRQMIEAMSNQGLWTSPGGKTPHATLYSAILREITVKGNESRFVKSERGKFAANA